MNIEDLSKLLSQLNDKDRRDLLLMISDEDCFYKCEFLKTISCRELKPIHSVSQFLVSPNVSWVWTNSEWLFYIGLNKPNQYFIPSIVDVNN